MHYSINIQGQPLSGSFTWEKGVYRFKNPYITMMKVLFTPLEGISNSSFNNIDSQNIVTNGKNEKVIFEKGFYTLAEIISMLNEMTYTSFSISNATNAFGCIQMSTNTSVDFSRAPEISLILGLSKSTYLAGQYHGDDIIDITRNRQVIQVFSSIVRTSDLKIANQQNNLLTTMILDDPQKSYINTIENVNIPICNRFDKLYFSFKTLDGKSINLYGQFELQLTIDDVISEDKSKITKLSQFSIAQVCNTPKTVVKLDRPLSFKQCYISSVSLYTDFQLYNIPEDQIVVIDGNITDHATIEIPKGVYEIEELIALLNTSDALFELIYEAENAFKVSVNYFYRIDFLRAKIVQKILGFDKSVIIKGSDTIKKYFLSSSANKIVVTNGTISHVITIPSAYYTFTQFYEAVGTELIKVIPITRMKIHTEYIEYECSENWYFDRSSVNTTINNFDWTPWFKVNSSLKNLCIERPDITMNGRNGYCFLPETYVLYDNLITKNMSFYFIDPTVQYTMTENDTTLASGSFNLATNDYTPVTIVSEIVNNLNTIYQHAKNIESTAENATPFEASVHQITTNTYAPTLTLSVVATNHTGNCVKKSNKNYVFEVWSKDVEYGQTVSIDKDITYTVQYSTDSVIESYTIAKGVYNQEKLINDIVANINHRQTIVGKPRIVATKTLNQRTQILCRDNTVPSIITTCSDVMFPIPNKTWRGFFFTYRQVECVKMPRLATPQQYLTAFKNGIKSTLFKEMTNNTIQTKCSHKIYFVNPTSLTKVSPSFNNNTQSSFFYYRNTTTINTQFQILLLFHTKLITNNTHLTYKNSSNVTKTITLQSGYHTQEEFIQDMNTQFDVNDIPLIWNYTSDAYMIKTDDPFTLTCSLLDDSFFGPSTPVSGAISHIWRIPFNQRIQLDNTDALYSDNPVDITNNLSLLKLYCNIVKSKTKPLLCNINIDDLHKNYFYKNRLIIPCSDQLDRLEYEFRNENDQELSFLGNIYLLITFTVQE